MDQTEFLALVGENIRRARWIAGLTQEQVTGVTLRYYQEIERGKRNPTLITLQLLADQFGVTVADFVNVHGARPAKQPLDRRAAKAPKAGRKPRLY